MEKINKLTMPATILIASFVLGGFYLTSQLIKQGSIERQQQAELQLKKDAEKAIKDKEDFIKLQKSFCVSEAEQTAIELNTESCKLGEYCIKGEGMYLVAQYENAYKTCTQRKGLD